MQGDLSSSIRSALDGRSERERLAGSGGESPKRITSDAIMKNVEKFSVRQQHLFSNLRSHLIHLTRLIQGVHLNQAIDGFTEVLNHVDAELVKMFGSEGPVPQIKSQEADDDDDDGKNFLSSEELSTKDQSPDGQEWMHFCLDEWINMALNSKPRDGGMKQNSPENSSQEKDILIHNLAKFLEHPFIFLLSRDNTKKDVPFKVLEEMLVVWYRITMHREYFGDETDDWVRYLNIILMTLSQTRYFPTTKKLRPSADDADKNVSKNSKESLTEKTKDEIASREELQTSFLQLFNLLFSLHSPKDLSSKFVLLVPLSEIISLLLQFAEETSFSRNVRLLSLQCLHTILQLFEKKTLAPIVPGIISSIVRIVQKSVNTRVGHALLQEVYRIISYIVAYVFNDPPVHESSQKTGIDILKSFTLSSKDTVSENVTNKLKDFVSPSEDGHEASQGSQSDSKQEKDSKDSRKTFSQIEELERRLELIFSSDKFYSLHPLTREVMIAAAYHIHINCKYTLRNFDSQLVEMIMIASFDETEYSTSRVRVFGNRLLEKVKRELNSDCKTFAFEENFGFFEDRFSTIVQKLFSFTTIVNEFEKISLISLLNAYLHTFGTKLWPVLLNQFSNVTLPLFTLLQFKESDKIQEVTYHSNIYLKTIGDEVGRKFVPRFQHLHEDLTIRSLNTLCRYLGEVSDPAFLWEHFRATLMSGNFLVSKEALYALKESLPGLASRADFSSKRRIFMEMLEFFVAGKFIPSISNDNAPNILLIHQHTVLTCISLESIAILVKSLSKCYSETLLIKCLFPILQKLGDSHGIVQDAALNALHEISLCMGYQNIAELISKNADYIVDDICYRMQDLNLYPDTPLILEVLLRHSEIYSSQANAHTERQENVLGSNQGYQSFQSYENMIGLVRDTLSSIFEGMDNHLHASKQNSTALQTFFSMLRSISQLLIARRKRTHEDGDHGFDNSSDDDDFSQADLDEKDNLDYNTGKYPHVKQDNEKSEQSLETTLMKQILQRCEHFAQVDDIRIQSQVLDLFLESSEFYIRGNKVDEHLLPILHSLWPAIRFFIHSTDHPMMQIKCFKLLTNLISRSTKIGEFLYGKFLEDVWSPLYKTLRHTLSPKSLISTYEARVTLFSESYLATAERGDLLNQIYEQEVSKHDYKFRITTITFLKHVLESDVFRQRISIVAFPKEKTIPFSFKTVIEVLFMFLDERLPLELQSLAMDTLRALCFISSDPLWFYLSEIEGGSFTFEGPSDFQPITIRRNERRIDGSIKVKHLLQNSRILLNEIERKNRA